MLHAIVFSRNRPLQLHGLLKTLINNLTGVARVDVLLNVDAEYVDAYAQIAATFDNVGFFDQSDSFASDMHTLIAMPADYVVFLCDDVLSQREIDMSAVDSLLSDQRIIGISLRLARHITHGMFWNKQPQPVFESAGRFLVWDMSAATGDWRYPWDVAGTIYRHRFVQDMWPHLKGASNPSQFEDTGSRVWTSVTPQHHYACWSEARTTVPTPNVVQQEFGNGYVGRGELDPAFLLDCWNHNLRMDTDRFDGLYETWRIADFHLYRV